MRMFRRRPGQPKYGPKILQMRLAHSPFAFGYAVNVRPLGRGVPRVFLQIVAGNGGCGGYLTEDEVGRLAQALFDGIEQSKALMAEEYG